MSKLHIKLANKSVTFCGEGNYTQKGGSAVDSYKLAGFGLNGWLARFSGYYNTPVVPCSTCQHMEGT